MTTVKLLWFLQGMLAIHVVFSLAVVHESLRAEPAFDELLHQVGPGDVVPEIGDASVAEFAGFALVLLAC